MSVQERVAQIVMGMPDEEAYALLSMLEHHQNPQKPYTETGSRKRIDFNSYGKPTERGKNADAYMEEIRGNDRF